MMRTVLMCAAVVAWQLAAVAQEGGVEIVSKGAAKGVIYFDPKAPESVKAGARELQRAVRIATGVTLPISDKPRAGMICLGDNAAARAAGVHAAQLPEENYVIVVRGGSVYIAGRDTPDGQRTARMGFSRGTQFGVYTFLEKALGVRWLMPGEAGEVIPKRDSLVVGDMNLREGPSFQFRQLHVVNRTPVVQEWLMRHKVSGFSHTANTACSRLVMVTHSWPWYIKKEVVKAHPEYLAVSGDDDKICTSQPGAVAMIADGVLEWLKDRPEWNQASISPSDGGGFCECAKCKTLIEKDWHGKASHTRAILKFYNDVAKLVAAKRPDVTLNGYVYYNYTYPPSKPVQMEPNVHLSLFPLNYYGFGLFKPAYRNEYEKLLSTWSGMAKDIGYGHWGSWVRSESGAPYGPGLEILKLEFPLLKKYGFNSIMLASSAAWGYAGLHNYLFAKLEWDAATDVDATYAEYLRLAYGEGWSSMDKVYRMLDAAMKDYKINVEPVEYRGSNFDVTYELIRHVHLPRMAEIESLYLEAMKAAKEEAQRKRIEMFGDNMVVFHYQLRKVDLLQNPEKSVFYRTDADYEAFLKSREGSLALAADTKGKTIIAPLWAPELRRLVIARLPDGVAAPVVDGDLDDAAWAKAAKAEDFRLAGSRRAPTQPTTARVTYDAKALYVAFECMDDKAGEMTVTEAKRDESRKVFANNTVELFFNPTAEKGKDWHLAVTPANVQWDGYKANATPNIEWRSAVKRAKDRWTVEIAVPFASLGVDAPSGATWRANMGRTLHRLREFSVWNSVEQVFTEAENFGEWAFGK